MNSKTDLELHVIALKYQLQAVLAVKDIDSANQLKFAILAAEESLKLHNEYRERLND